jgi:hypothetical protein
MPKKSPMKSPMYYSTKFFAIVLKTQDVIQCYTAFTIEVKCRCFGELTSSDKDPGHQVCFFIDPHYYPWTWHDFFFIQNGGYEASWLLSWIVNPCEYLEACESRKTNKQVNRLTTRRLENTSYWSALSWWWSLVWPVGEKRTKKKYTQNCLFVPAA